MEKQASGQGMIWHGVVTILMFVGAVAFIVTGALYIGNMYFDTFGISSLMDTLFADYPASESALTILSILYGLALIGVGMENFLAFNSMRITEKGGSYFMQKCVLHAVIVNAAFLAAAFLVIGVCIVGLSYFADKVQLAFALLIPAALALVTFVLYESNKPYYCKRNDEFIH